MRHVSIATKIFACVIILRLNPYKYHIYAFYIQSKCSIEYEIDKNFQHTQRIWCQHLFSLSTQKYLHKSEANHVYIHNIFKRKLKWKWENWYSRKRRRRKTKTKMKTTVEYESDVVKQQNKTRQLVNINNFHFYL